MAVWRSITVSAEQAQTARTIRRLRVAANVTATLMALEEEEARPRQLLAAAQLREALLEAAAAEAVAQAEAVVAAAAVVAAEAVAQAEALARAEAAEAVALEEAAEAAAAVAAAEAVLPLGVVAAGLVAVLNQVGCVSFSKIQLVPPPPQLLNRKNKTG